MASHSPAFGPTTPYRRVGFAISAPPDIRPQRVPIGTGIRAEGLMLAGGGSDRHVAEFRLRQTVRPAFEYTS